MSKFVLGMLFIILITGCGGSKSMYESTAPDAAYEPAPGAVPEDALSSQMEKEVEPSFGYGGMFAAEAREEQEVLRLDGAAPASAGSMPSSPPVAGKPPRSQPPQAQNKPRTAQEGPTDGPMIVYNGYLHLRVRRLMDALDEISKLTKENGGYVDAMTERSIVVRIPGKNFEEMLTTFARLGDVLSREISAVEVTEQYTDMTSRLAVAEETRERLLALLEKVSDARERLRVLDEIKRLSEQIESIKSTLSTLRNLLKYFTVTIDLTPILQEEAAIQHQSPFAWVRALSPHRTTLFGEADRIQMTLPSDFVLFSKADDYRAQAADTTVVRGGVVENNPKGDNTFWADAIIYEMTGRSESLEDRGKSGDVSWLLFKNDALQTRWYLVGVHVVGDDIFVLEVFFPNEEAFNSHQKDLLKAFETFEVTQ